MYKVYQEFAEELASLAKPVVDLYFRTALEVEDKASMNNTPVTVADKEIERLIRIEIEQRFPEHGIFGEEHGKMGIDRDFVWVIDPIDGTQAFILGMPTFGTLVGLLHKGLPVAGVIAMPALDDIWSSSSGNTSLFNGSVCRTSEANKLEDVQLVSTSIDMFDGDNLDAFNRLSDACKRRRFGGDCFSYGLLASGHVDLVVEADLQPYDYVALIPVIEQAGGVISDWDGRPLHLGSDGRVVAAATRQLHESALKVLAG
jgi:inositol-phosphate phosphatase / L-galactose 1-phosphate phosphatase / histidinol-phosphatase